MGGWSSSLPGAIDQLVLICTQAPELEGTAVRDGPTLSDSTQAQVLYIGWTGGDVDTDAETSVSPDGMAGNPDIEQSVIRCMAEVLLGNGTVGGARQAVYGILSDLGVVLDGNRTLNGTVMRAAIGTHALTQRSANGGATATVTFEVNTDAFTRR